MDCDTLVVKHLHCFLKQLVDGSAHGTDIFWRQGRLLVTLDRSEWLELVEDLLVGRRVLAVDFSKNLSEGLVSRSALSSFCTLIKHRDCRRYCW